MDFLAIASINSARVDGIPRCCLQVRAGRWARRGKVDLSQQDCATMAVHLPELCVGDAAAWRDWLDTNHEDPGGVWLVVAKKGTTEPTSLTYDQAVEEALCFGWIDGQAGRRDEATFLQRFTRRRRQSPWSRRNVDRVERLHAAGRMRPAGLAEVERAKADGRWAAAYAGSASIEVPDDLATALAAEPTARAAFDSLSRTNRFAILYRIGGAKKPETRVRRIEQFVAMLARGETTYRQRSSDS
jgi:uncharacterized protein YdeI (YjbR/CyaY-like superfamily)